MSDIFLSYASKDLEWAKVLASTLVSEGWSVFYDRTIPPGKTWRQFIGKHIEECSCMVVVWSKHSINSRWVLEEADIALEKNILIPVFLDQVKPPFGFGSIQAADLINWQGNKHSPGYLALCTVITELIGAGKLLLPEQTFSPTKVIPSAGTKKKLIGDNNVPLKSSAASKNTFIEPKMVIIPAGSFEMGSSMSPSQQPIHTVNIREPLIIAFFMIFTKLSY